MAVKRFSIGPLGTNSYVINKDKTAICIDVGGEPAEILDYLKEEDFSLCAICLTHRHFDHVYGVADLAAATNAPVYSPVADEPIAQTESGQGGIWGLPLVKPFDAKPLPIGKNIFGNMECIVLETPGHTPGGVSLYFPEESCVFTGDALFFRSIGRTDFPMGDHPLLIKSIKENLFTLPDDVIAYPGHGPQTTIGNERKTNPFVGEFVE